VQRIRELLDLVMRAALIERGGDDRQAIGELLAPPGLRESLR